ncbi:MAG: nickel pincer cofactor biosynthesis protein LarC [Deltaproteobacteria bacterium]|nr:nickel pincer cofactor biosynthesis protein LarC [Deltaproteobacteria bacterium]MBW2445015.1 nickel pincer cofactor biosynthesis protein LarC [Deltaproteobacteria bacterium]
MSKKKRERAAPGARVLHLDTFAGCAGNMFLGALLDAGLSRHELEDDLQGLGVAHRLKVSRVERGALAAQYVDVALPKVKKKDKKSHSHGHGHGRHWAEIRDVLEQAKLDPGVRETALAIFEEIGRAEAKVHGIELEKVHFHEVGAVDAIVDVAGAAIAVARLGIERVTASPPALGHGTVETQHGRLPLPAPATLEILKGIPTVPAHIEWETVTPTGAAILKVLVDEFRELPAMTVEAIGHGAGNEREGPMPNVLRAVVGRTAGIEADRVVSLEANLDDLVPEHFDHLMERLFDAGALDVGIQHLQMKKNRPGFLIRALARPADRIALARILFSESTTAGVRSVEYDRLVLHRKQIQVKTRYGKIRVKIVRSPDGRSEPSPEYDDCKAAARKHDAPLRDVVRAAEKAARE